ncbi:MAG: hypothetical protein H6Q41_5953 [Deltaproteobacteria bacterium]|nr:hypothetical protein [Deltaproteobacteria bacterium]
MAKVKNPFIYGGRVAGDTFCNRQKEIKELLSDIMTRHPEERGHSRLRRSLPCFKFGGIH